MSSVYDNQLAGEGPLPSIQPATTATGPGVAVTYVTPRLNHTMYMVSTGTGSGGVVALEVSPDGKKWVSSGATGATSGTPNGVSYITYTGAVAKFVRGNMTVGPTGGGTVSVYFYGV
jgi:hypothetical protein